MDSEEEAQLEVSVWFLKAKTTVSNEGFSRHASDSPRLHRVSLTRRCEANAPRTDRHSPESLLCSSWIHVNDELEAALLIATDSSLCCTYEYKEMLNGRRES